MSERTVCWFSCGAPSAVAAKIAISEGPAIVVYTEVIEEHEDNKRFLADCEKWLGQSIVRIKNEKYGGSIYEVFKRSRYLVGPGGAACTRLLKKGVRQQFERPTDRQVFGYTVEEQNRVDRFIDANSEVNIWCPLIERGLTKPNCKAMIERAGIELPMMYRLGYQNNNCIGCVKGQAGYWNKIRVDFPEVFERMAKTEELLGRTVCKVERGGVRTRPSLRDLPLDAGNYPAEPEVECGIFCEMVERDYTR